MESKARQVAQRIKDMCDAKNKREMEIRHTNILPPSVLMTIDTITSDDWYRAVSQIYKSITIADVCMMHQNFLKVMDKVEYEYYRL